MFFAIINTATGQLAEWQLGDNPPGPLLFLTKEWAADAHKNMVGMDPIWDIQAITAKAFCAFFEGGKKGVYIRNTAGNHIYLSPQEWKPLEIGKRRIGRFNPEKN